MVGDFVGFLSRKLKHKRTKLFPILRKKVDEVFSKLEREKVTPWIFCAGAKVFHMDKCRGGEINWGGFEYDGTAELVFWNGFIEPCLEDSIEMIFEYTGYLCKESNLIPGKYLQEAADLLKGRVRKIYMRMADIDRRLRGKGYP